MKKVTHYRDLFPTGNIIKKALFHENLTRVTVMYTKVAVMHTSHSQDDVALLVVVLLGNDNFQKSR